MGCCFPDTTLSLSNSFTKMLNPRLDVLSVINSSISRADGDSTRDWRPQIPAVLLAAAAAATVCTISSQLHLLLIAEDGALFYAFIEFNPFRSKIRLFVTIGDLVACPVVPSRNPSITTQCLLTHPMPYRQPPTHAQQVIEPLFCSVGCRLYFKRYKSTFPSNPIPSAISIPSVVLFRV